MAKYLAFSYDTYYPEGGMSDCIGVFDSFEEAVSAADAAGGDYGEVYEAGSDGFHLRTYENGTGVRRDSRWVYEKIDSPL